MFLLLYAYILLMGCVGWANVNTFVIRCAGDMMETFSSWLEGSIVFNAVTVVVICVTGSAVVGRRLEGRYNPLILMTSLFFIYQLIYNDRWEYVHIIWCFSYDALLMLVAVTIACVELYLLYVRYAEDQARELKLCKAEEAITAISKAGLATDTRSEDIIVTGRENWVKEIVERSLKTDVSRDSYAVGIAGGWGSGKTKFLNDIKDELGDTCKVLEFNPWNCTAPEQITSDFFSLLSSGLDDDDKEVEKSIRRYVSILTKSEITPSWVNAVTEVLGKDMHNSLESAKKEVQKHVSSYPCKVAVLIDDIDRLEKNELFEVLRLIRASANFSNMIFFVAYDRKYIVDMLEANEVKAASQYIKKIFQVEISLPDFEGYVLPRLLVRELRKMISCGDKVMKALAAAAAVKRTNGEYTLLRYLRNFRDVKRFASSFAVNFSACNGAKDDFALVIGEFFWVEILKYSDYDAYERLRTTPYAFLVANSARSQPEHLQVFHGDGYKSLNDDSARILDMLFGKYGVTSDDCNSIRMSYNFANYFSYRVHEDKVQSSEFYQLLQNDKDGDETIYNTIDIWCRAAVPKTTSLYHLIMNYKTAGRGEKECMAFLKALFAFGRHCPEENISNLFKEKLNNMNYKADVAYALREPASGMLENLLHERQFSQAVVSSILKELHSVCSREMVDEDDCYVYKYNSVIPDDVLCVLACDDIRKRFLESDVPAITDITREGSSFRKYLESMTFVYVYDAEDAYYEDRFVNLTFSELLKHYGGCRSTEFKDFVAPFDYSKESLRYESVDEELDSIDFDIRKLFGTTDNYRHFIDECFEVDPEVKEGYYNRCHIRP